jgi:hypothetical protein
MGVRVHDVPPLHRRGLDGRSQLPVNDIENADQGTPHASETIETADRTALTPNNSTDIEMAQVLSADIERLEN